MTAAIPASPLTVKRRGKSLKGGKIMLKTLRNKLDLSLQDVADIMKVNVRTIRRWDDGGIDTPHAVILVLEYMERENA